MAISSRVDNLMNTAGDQDFQLSPNTRGITLCGKAWTAYVSIVVRAVILIGACVALWIWRPDMWTVALPILLLGVGLIGYRIAWLRSFRLYYDDAGVWIYSGLLPWKRGVAGVKWRDLDEAIFVNGFWSWLSRAYTVRLTHRFTKESEILLSEMARGREVVQQINQQHRQYIHTEHGTAAAQP
jgi:hypothetical protein